MLRERSLLDWPLLVGLLAVTVDLMIGMPAQPQAAPPLAPEAAPVESEYERLMDQIAVILQRADSRYRAGDAAGAAELVRGLTPNGEYATLAELYEHLALELAVVRDPAADPRAAFEALVRARSLDMALGGALADDLTARARDLAPRAAEAYDAAADRRGAGLARHTAELAGAR